MPKSKREGISDTIEINGKTYATVQKAQQILTELATSLGTPRSYSRSSVFRLAIEHGVDTVTTPTANFYNVEDLRNLRLNLQPHRGMPKGLKRFPKETKEQALLLHQQGVLQIEIAKRLGVSDRTIRTWIRTLEDRTIGSE